MKFRIVNHLSPEKKRTGLHQSLKYLNYFDFNPNINIFIRNHVLSHHKDLGEQNIAVLLDKIRNMQLPEPEFVSETSNHVDQ